MAGDDKEQHVELLILESYALGLVKSFAVETMYPPMALVWVPAGYILEE
jgi:hypothetical protein